MQGGGSSSLLSTISSVNIIARKNEEKSLAILSVDSGESNDGDYFFYREEVQGCHTPRHWSPQEPFLRGAVARWPSLTAFQSQLMQDTARAPWSHTSDDMQ